MTPTSSDNGAFYRHALRYVLTSAIVYLFILAALYFLVDLVGANPTVAYVVVFLAAYLAEYTMTLLFVFERRHSRGNLVRYVLYVALFLGVSTLLYELLRVVGVHYLLSAVLTSVLLMPLRFLLNRRWVYR